MENLSGNNNIADLIKQGIAAANAQQTQQAIACFTKVVRQDRGNVEAWIWLARLMDEPGTRRKCLEMVRAVDPENLEARFMLVELEQAENPVGAQPGPVRPAIPAKPITAKASEGCYEKLVWGLVVGILILLLLGAAGFLLAVKTGLLRWGPTPTPEAVTSGTGMSNVFVEYILDGSGSMQESLPDGTRKSDAATTLLSKSLGTYRPETNVGFRVYGHRIPLEGNEQASCQDIELVAPIAPGFLGNIVSWMSGYKPQGMTPITASLRQAMADFQSGNDRLNSVVLISDGQETCGGDPCALVDEIKAQGLRFTLYVIGLNVDDPTRQQLTCIAQQGGGIYQDANNSQQLQQALDVVQTQIEEEANDSPTPAPVVITPETPTVIPPSSTPTAVKAQTLFEGQIAYIGVDGNVYLARGDTGEIHQVTNDANTQERYFGLAFSSNGENLAFARLDAEKFYDDNGPLFVVDTNLFTTRQITDRAISGFEWFSDGSKLGYVQEQTLYLSKLSDLSNEKITDDVADFDISPNNEFIAYTKASSAGMFGPSELWLLNLSTKASESIVGPGEGCAHSVNWAPNGKWIYFDCAGPEWGGWDFWNYDTKSIHRVNLGSNIAWSPKDEMFAGAQYINGPSPSGYTTLRLFDPAGNELADSGINIDEFSFSPDGEWIAGTGQYYGQPFTLIKINGTQLNLKTPLGGQNVIFRKWSPSGRQILLTGKKPEQSDQFLPIEFLIYDTSINSIVLKNVFASSKYGAVFVAWGKLPFQQASDITPRPTEKQANATPTPSTLPLYQQVRLVTTNYKETGQNPDYTIDLQIPILEGSNDPRVETFNKGVAALVQREIKSFKDSLSMNMTASNSASGYLGPLSYELISPPGQILSLRVRITAAIVGSAHPYHNSASYNYDLEAGQEITLSQLFLGSVNPLPVIADYSQRNAPDYTHNLGGGFDPTPENYRVWNISAAGLAILFNEYQVASYADGPVPVVIPYDVLKDMIDPTGPLAAFMP